MASPEKLLKEIKGGTDIMLETILPIITTIQTQNARLEQRMRGFEQDLHEFRAASQPAASASTGNVETPCSCGDLSSRIDGLVTSLKETDAKINKLMVTIDANSSSIQEMKGSVDASNLTIEALKQSTDVNTEQQDAMRQAVDNSEAATAQRFEEVSAAITAQSAMLQQTVRYSAVSAAHVQKGLPTLRPALSQVTHTVTSHVEKVQEDVRKKLDGLDKQAASATSKEMIVKRFTSTKIDVCGTGIKGWVYGGRPDEIFFTVDKPVSVAGFTLYGCISGTAEHKVTMKLVKTNSKQNLASNELTFTSDGTDKEFPVKFARPVDIEADTKYTASVTISGERTWHGCDGQKSVQGEGGVTFSFSKSPSPPSNGGGVGFGQIPGIIYQV